MSTARRVQKALRQHADPIRAQGNARFFKTGHGQYGERDVFIGVTVPLCRGVAKTYHALSFSEIKTLLSSPVHEDRLVALEILVLQYEEGDQSIQEQVYRFYLTHKRYVNNWDLVDLSAPYIVGHFLYKKRTTILRTLARSRILWERRIAIVATYYFIQQGQYTPTLVLAKMLMKDREDLIHKAVGWMLREVGKKDEMILIHFLDRYFSVLPRTTLRYAIERLSQHKKKHYMKK